MIGRRIRKLGATPFCFLGALFFTISPGKQVGQCCEVIGFWKFVSLFDGGFVGKTAAAGS